MDTKLTIQKIHNVYDGILLVGRTRAKRRKSDGFVYVFSGSAVYSFDSYSFTAQSGNIMLLSKDNSYTIDVETELRYICVDFDFEPSEKIRKSEVFSNLSADIKNIATRLLRVWLQKNLWCLAETQSLTIHIYAECIKSSAKTYAHNSQTVYKAINYITEHYTDPELSMPEIAAHIGISEVHLRRIFHAAVNTTPLRYINNLRLKHAKDMLRHSNCGIAETAQVSGFSSPYYFSKFFRKEVGISPKEYRLNNDFLE